MKIFFFFFFFPSIICLLLLFFVFAFPLHKLCSFAYFGEQVIYMHLLCLFFPSNDVHLCVVVVVFLYIFLSPFFCC